MKQLFTAQSGENAMFMRQDEVFGAEKRKANSVGGTLKRLGRYFRPYTFALLVVALVVIGSTYMQVLIPDLTGQIVDCYITPFAAGSTLQSQTSVEPAAGPTTHRTKPGFCEQLHLHHADLSATAAETISGIGGLSLLITGLYIGNAILSGLGFYLMSWAGFKVLRDLRAKVFVHVHRLSLGYFTRHEAGDVMSRFTNDIDTWRR
jgi:ATP-binding cassette, subfamily B, multidrug efflux pump